jgi:hypothetical protein
MRKAGLLQRRNIFHDEKPLPASRIHAGKPLICSAKMFVIYKT